MKYSQIFTYLFCIFISYMKYVTNIYIFILYIYLVCNIYLEYLLCTAYAFCIFIPYAKFNLYIYIVVTIHIINLFRTHIYSTYLLHLKPYTPIFSNIQLKTPVIQKIGTFQIQFFWYSNPNFYKLSIFMGIWFINQSIWMKKDQILLIQKTRILLLLLQVMHHLL